MIIAAYADGNEGYACTNIGSNQNDCYVDARVQSIISEINKEYGTNIRALNSVELKKFDVEFTKLRTDNDFNQFSKELRDIAENEIPAIHKTTADALKMLSCIDNKIDYEVELDSAQNVPIKVVKAIDYAVATATASIINNHYGTPIWGQVKDVGCETNTSLARWFYSENPTVTKIDGRRTLYWVGQGNYYANVLGQPCILSSGTQYAYMYVTDYIT